MKRLIIYILMILVVTSCTLDSDNDFEMAFYNRTHTDVSVEIDSVKRVLSPGYYTVFRYSENPDIVEYLAKTSGLTKDSTIIGEELKWNYKVDVSEVNSSNISLGYSSDFFFVYMKNSSLDTLGPLVVNYQDSIETIDSIYIAPAEGTTYRIGYYKAAQDTKIVLHTQDSTKSFTWTNGIDFEFPGGDNQSLVINIDGQKNIESDNKRLNDDDFIEYYPNKQEVK